MRQLKISRKITERENNSLDFYLKEISRLGMISPDEEVSLAQRIKEGDRSALSKLVESNLRFVVSVSKQYMNQGLTLQDLINEGNVGLIKAAHTFDETRGFKFISYSVWWIRQSILLALAEQARMIRLPQNKIGVLGKIKKASIILEQRLERSPEPHEIAAFLEVPENEVVQTIRSNSVQLSLDTPLQSDDTMNLYDLLPNEDKMSNPDVRTTLNSLAKDLERVLSTLSIRESRIIRYLFGIGIEHPLTLKEVSEKMDLSCERIR